jgi:carbamoylphosphate synthase large subunit
MRIAIFPYKNGSRSVRQLKDNLPIRTIELLKQGSRFVRRITDVIINWGASDCPFTEGVVLNSSEAIAQVSNKLTFFRASEPLGRLLPQFWTDRGQIPPEAFPVVCRTVLQGHSGQGIVIARDQDQLVNAPLYTKYIKKKDEYRIHCGRNREDQSYVFSVQRKARRMDVENPNWEVRNHQNGFIYTRTDVNPPECVTQAALEVFSNFALDFGAVDVIYNERSSQAYVLEINSAPGLEGQTVEDYVEFFRNRLIVN